MVESSSDNSEELSTEQGSHTGTPSPSTSKMTGSRIPSVASDPTKSKRLSTHTASSNVHADASQPGTPRRRHQSSHTVASPEPELIMPSIHEEQMDGSRADVRKKRNPDKGLQASQRTKFETAERVNSSPIQDRMVKAAEEIERIFKLVLGCCLDILGGALRISKTPISYLLAIYMLFGLMVFTRNMLTKSIYCAISPVCRLPGASLLNLEMCKSPMATNYNGEETPPVEFDQLMKTQSKFEDILEQTADGISLPLDMKRSEASIRDLRQVVRYSQLRSKNELVLEFDNFVETARIASFDLQRFNSHVGRSVDNVLATARWTSRVIEGIAERDAGRGAIASFVTDKVLAPFQPLKFTEDALLDQYIKHTQTVELEIHRLIEEAQAILLVLQNLEDRLDTIHGISIRDNKHAQYSRDEILSQLWTILGGNRTKLGKFESELKLLQQVNGYRQSAFGYVAGTILKLQEMQTELEELRVRVGSAELLRDKADIPLSVHIENIQLGVARLEVGREKSMRLQGENMLKRLDRGEGMGIGAGEKRKSIDITLR